MPAMASSLRAATAMLKRHAPAALCFELHLPRQAFFAGPMRAVAAGEGLGLLAPFIGSDPNFCSLEIFPPSPHAAPDLLSRRFTFPAIPMAKVVQEAFHAIPIPEILHEGVPTLSPSLTQNSHRFLLGGVAVTGMILLAEESSEKPEDVLAGQTAGVVELLREQLEKAGQLEAENQKLRQDASNRDRQLSHELQIEIARQAHEEAMAEYRIDEARLELEELRMKAEEKQGSDGDKGSGGDKNKPEDNQNKNKTEGDKNKSKSKNEEKEPLYKKFFRYYKPPSTTETLIKAVDENWVMWTQIGGVVTLALGLSRSESLKVFRGEFKIFDPRIEFPQTRTCPCGVPWPEVCCKCGRSLPAFIADAAGPIGAAPVGKDGTPTVAGSAVSKKGPAN